MARRERANGAKTRERILEVALPLFAQRGFAGTSIRRVAQAAQVNVATLAYHFQDKQGLYDTVVRRLHEELHAAFPTELPKVPPEELLQTLVRVGWRFARDHRVHIRLLHRHLLDQGRRAEAADNPWTEELLRRGERLVNGFRPDWSQQECRLFLFTFQSTVARFVIEDERHLAAWIGDSDDMDELIVRWLGSVVRRELGLSA